jgi:hypothetical protein
MGPRRPPARDPLGPALLAHGSLASPAHSNATCRQVGARLQVGTMVTNSHRAVGHPPVTGCLHDPLPGGPRGAWVGAHPAHITSLTSRAPQRSGIFPPGQPYCPTRPPHHEPSVSYGLPKNLNPSLSLSPNEEERGGQKKTSRGGGARGIAGAGGAAAGGGGARRGCPR